MTGDLKHEIEDTKVNLTKGMKRMTGDLKREIGNRKSNCREETDDRGFRKQQ